MAMPDSAITSALIPAAAAVLGSIITLSGIFVQSLLSAKLANEHSLNETRRIVYARLMSAIMSEDSYPIYSPPTTLGVGFQESIDAYNSKLEQWRANRRTLQGIAAEALLVSDSSHLRAKLKDFIESKDPDLNLKGIETLLRKEILFNAQSGA